MIRWIHRTVRGGMFLITLLMAALGLAGAVTVTRTAGWQWPVTAWALLTLTPFAGWGLYQRNDRGWVAATSLLATAAALVILLVVTPLQIPSAIALSLLFMDLALITRRLRQEESGKLIKRKSSEDRPVGVCAAAGPSPDPWSGTRVPWSRSKRSPQRSIWPTFSHSASSTSCAGITTSSMASSPRRRSRSR